MTPLDAEALKKGEKLFRQEARFVAGVQNPSMMIPPDIPEIAFAGRSNVGKSSLINALVGMKALARASSTPGRTQQINFFDLGGRIYIVDLPGYGHAVASKAKIAVWTALIRAYLQTRVSLKRVCVLIDSRQGIRALDQDMMEMLDAANVPYIVVLTKCDKLKPRELEDIRERIGGELKNYKGAYPTLCETSSSSSSGIPELRAILAMV